MSEEVVVKVNGRVIFRYVVVLIIYFAFAVLIDGIIKGKVWARATYMGLAGLGIFWKFMVFILNPFIIFPPLLDITLILIEVALIVLLFVQPASQWFVKKKKKKIARQDILDDL
ncbi:hypothetical protein N9355_01850 [Crocinitomicaceae bacterium]|nr:hypothetical protein [Crocinitomicaceae bacterium]